MRTLLVGATALVSGVTLSLGLGTAVADDPPRATSAATAVAPRAPGAVDAPLAKSVVARLEEDVRGLGGRLGASVVSLPARTVLAASSEHVAMNPASNAKLATAAAALDVLGPEHRFVTGLHGTIDRGTVDPLVLRGRGDPTLDTAALAELVGQLAPLGVTRVGRIVVDSSHFSAPHVPPAFGQQPDEWASFRAPVAATSIDRNVITLWVHAGRAGERARVTASPPGYVDVEGEVKTAGRDEREAITLTLAPRGDRVVARVGGVVPEGSALVPLVRRADDPARLAGFALRSLLASRGIADADAPVELGAPKATRALALHASRPLGEIVSALGKESDNFTAEMLLLGLGAPTGGTFEAGSAAVEAALRARGALDAGVEVTNGSGLFDADRQTAAALTSLLASVSADPRIAPEYLAHLAVGGRDGTLKHRFRSWGERGAIRAKTGTLAAVIGLSGYVLGPDGRPALAFSFLVDGVRGKTSDARAALDRATEQLARAAWDEPHQR